MRFAIISDIHLWLEKKYKNVSSDRKINFFLSNFISEMNNNVKPDFVIVLGDIIEDLDKKSDEKNLEKIKNIFSTLNCPIYYAAWNHDLVNISKKELAKFINKDELYYSFDKNDYHFIVLFSEEIDEKNIIISDTQKNT